MPSSSQVLAFALVSFVLIAVPGPSVLFSVGRALALGRLGGWLTVVGNSLGVFAMVVLIALGLGAVIERSVLVFNVLKFAGAAYLVYLGVQAIRHRRDLAGGLESGVTLMRSRRVLLEGFVVGITNPKAAVFFASVLPQFVDTGAGHVTTQILLLGAVFQVMALICDSIWALAAGTAREWIVRDPRRLAAMGGIGGVSMIGLGIGIAFTGRKD